MITLTDKKLVEMTKKYNEYLSNHIMGVNRTYNEILKPILEKEFLGYKEPPINLQALGYRIHSHDKSKRTDYEYKPYLVHWYAGEENKTEESEKAYRYAVLHHVHINEHHWQFWVHPDDYDGSTHVLDMNLESVIEMLCDWHSFTLRDPESTAYKWYQDNKSNMILGKGTIELIDKYIIYLQKPLSKES